MSVSGIMRRNEWPELKEYLKKASPVKEDFFEEYTVSADSQIIDLLDEYQLTLSESTIVGGLSDFLFALVLCKYLTQHKERSLNSLIKPIQKYVEEALCSQNIREMGKSVLRDIESYANGEHVSFSSLVAASHFYYVVENYGAYCSNAEERDASFVSVVSLRCQKALEKLVSSFETIMVDNKLIKPTSIVIFHPSFEPWGSYIGGAIADLFIDGNIIEVKSGKREKNRWTDIGQVYLYYLLHRLCSEDTDYKDDYTNDYTDISSEDVTGIGLYYSRTADLRTCPIKLLNELRKKNDEMHIRRIIALRLNPVIEKNYNDNLALYAKVLLQNRIYSIKSGNRPMPIYSDHDDYPYKVGEKIYLYKLGWGKLNRLVYDKNTTTVIVDMENGKRFGFPISKTMFLISINDPELTKIVPPPRYIRSD